LLVGSDRYMPWFVVLVGFCAMYVPVYWWAAQGIWQSDDHGHGPIILAVVVWLFWSIRGQLLDTILNPRARGAGRFLHSAC